MQEEPPLLLSWQRSPLVARAPSPWQCAGQSVGGQPGNVTHVTRGPVRKARARAAQSAHSSAARSQRAVACTHGAADAAAAAVRAGVPDGGRRPPTPFASDYVCFQQHLPRCAL